MSHRLLRGIVMPLTTISSRLPVVVAAEMEVVLTAVEELSGAFAVASVWSAWALCQAPNRHSDALIGRWMRSFTGHPVVIRWIDVIKANKRLAGGVKAGIFYGALLGAAHCFNARPGHSISDTHAGNCVRSWPSTSFG